MGTGTMGAGTLEGIALAEGAGKVVDWGAFGGGGTLAGSGRRPGSVAASEMGLGGGNDGGTLGAGYDGSGAGFGGGTGFEGDMGWPGNTQEYGKWHA